MTEGNKAMRIDVEAVLRERVPAIARHVPRFMTEWLKRLIRQDDLNKLLLDNVDRRDAEFCAGVLHDLNVSYDIVNAGSLPGPADSRVTYVSNHPLGALDGIALIDMLSRRHPGKRLRFVVNDLLGAVKPLNGVFVPINKHGAQTRAASATLTEAFESDNPVIVFPAGLVSRKGRRGAIHDLAWHKMFVNKSIATHRDIVPLYFSGNNSKFFYNFAKFRKSIGIKFNFEMVLLPREIFNCRDKRFEIIVGPRIAAETLCGGSQAEAQAREICDIVYGLPAKA